MNAIDRLARLPGLRWVLGHRFLKFGAVGASGTVVNLGVLYLGQEFLLRAIEPVGTRLNASLALAIFFATVNNFAWNRAWTWADRKQRNLAKPLPLQFGQYALACWFAIALQVVFTKILAGMSFHYLVANLTAIVLASVFNFVLNDLWAFGRMKSMSIARGREPPGENP
jgi:dolichol-phosphate mannosyltransferase